LRFHGFALFSGIAQEWKQGVSAILIVGAIAKAMENSQLRKRMILGKRRHFGFDNGKARLDLDALFVLLAVSCWSQGIPRETVDRSISGSGCFGLYQSGQQVGFGRVITDGATFAYLCDVIVMPNFRGRPIGK
jgi:hypothetical protein